MSLPPVEAGQHELGRIMIILQPQLQLLYLFLFLFLVLDIFPYHLRIQTQDNLRNLLTASSFQSMLRQQLDQGIAVSGHFGHSHAGPANPIPHDHTHRGGFLNFSKKAIGITTSEIFSLPGQGILERIHSMVAGLLHQQFKLR